MPTPRYCATTHTTAKSPNCPCDYCQRLQGVVVDPMHPEAMTILDPDLAREYARGLRCPECGGDHTMANEVAPGKPGREYCCLDECGCQWAGDDYRPL